MIWMLIYTLYIH